MQIESDRIIIRDLEQNDVESFINIASDGTLSDIFGDCTECSHWMGAWLKEAMDLYNVDNPYKEYLAYAIVDKKSNQVMGSVGCSAYEDICEVGITYFFERNMLFYNGMMVSGTADSSLSGGGFITLLFLTINQGS